MPENASFNGCIDRIELGFVEREATPRLLMKLSIQLHLAGISLSNTISILEMFGVERARSTVHNWVHKADLQPEEGRSPDHVAVDETVIRLNDEQYWLYAAVDPETNELLHTKLEPTRTNVIAYSFFRELREKHDVDDAVFLVDSATPLKDACRRHGLDFQIRTPRKSEQRRTCIPRDKTQNYHFFELFQQRRSRNCERVAQILRLRMESANLNTTVCPPQSKFSMWMTNPNLGIW
ncbi:IS6 family transposase [Haloplanus halobius]|uniref:IS6 family transposase n=1 Tax=Haloplanus halobius TaxID=2934938 RepID=UPI00200F6419|nr:IS6 family transposase [Haloplanus sp. XH21]